MSLISGKEMHYQVLCLHVQTRRPDHAMNQAVSSKLSDRRLRKTAGAKCAAKLRNIQFATACRTEMLAAENSGDWHAAVGDVPCSSVSITLIKEFHTNVFTCYSCVNLSMKWCWYGTCNCICSVFFLWLHLISWYHCLIVGQDNSHISCTVFSLYLV